MTDYTLAVANRVYVNKPGSTPIILDNYRENLRKFYDANIDEVNFESDGDRIVKECNEWITKLTDGLIDKVLDEELLAPAILMVLINAIYFQGRWSKKFDANKTQLAPFHNHGEVAKDVPTMYMEDDFIYNEKVLGNGKKVQILQIKYSEWRACFSPCKNWYNPAQEMFQLEPCGHCNPKKESNASIFIILPERMDDLEHVLEGLSVEDFQSIDNGLKKKVEVFLPK